MHDTKGHRMNSRVYEVCSKFPPMTKLQAPEGNTISVAVPAGGNNENAADADMT